VLKRKRIINVNAVVDVKMKSRILCNPAVIIATIAGVRGNES
jgi:hypothetical protein